MFDNVSVTLEVVDESFVSLRDSPDKLSGAFWSLLEKDDQSSAFRSKLPGITAAFLHFDQVAAAVDGVEGAEAPFPDDTHATRCFFDSFVF